MDAERLLGVVNHYLDSPSHGLALLYLLDDTMRSIADSPMDSILAVADHLGVKRPKGEFDTFITLSLIRKNLERRPRKRPVG